MKLLHGTEINSLFEKGSVVTIGNFDGVHLGHQALLASLCEEAKRRELPLVVILFEPQPGEYFSATTAPARLTSLREKLQILAECQVDFVFCIKFNALLAQMSAADFAQKYIFSRLKAKFISVGEDFRFGKGRLGDVSLLQELGKQSDCLVQIFPDYASQGARISSTRIRASLALGQLEQAAALLGRSYSLCGRVVRGAGRGKQWGVPTANILLQRLTLPLKGVFGIQATTGKGKLVQGVANIGNRPTVDGSKNVLEIHLLNFNECLYGDILQVFFLFKLRDEIKFPSVEALIAQIHTDIAAAKEKFSSHCFELNA